LALNRPGLIEAFKTQEQIDLSRWVPHGGEFATPRASIATLPGFRSDKTQDIADARKLLADAGYANGVPGVELLSASVPPHAEIMAPAIQDQLKNALGMEINIRVAERSLLVEDQKAGRFTLVLDTPGSPISDFSPMANTYFKTGGSQNYGGYSNTKFDALLKQSDRELDASKRRALLDQMQDLLDQDPPWLFIGYTDHLLMWGAKVRGLALDKRVVSEWGRVEIAWLDAYRRGVQRYLLRRVITAVPTLFGITVLIFVAMRILPGDPLAQIASEGQGQYRLTDDELKAARASLGLDRPLPEQYLIWMADVAHGDMGHSFWNTEPIRQTVARR